jgi:hypothetical protein
MVKKSPPLPFINEMGASPRKDSDFQTTDGKYPKPYHGKDLKNNKSHKAKKASQSG